MKLSRSILGISLLFAALALAGCRKEKTEPFGPDLAAASAPLALSTARPEDVKALSQLQQKLLLSASKVNKGSFSIDLLGPSLLLATLLNASENESLEKLSMAMGVPGARDDLFTKSAQAQLDHLACLKESGLKQGTALWMIWPILLTPDFQNEMGEKLGVSVYRLGNAGITSSERITDWARKVGAGSPPPPSLTKLDVMTATTVMGLDLSGLKPQGSSQVKGRSLSCFKTPSGVQLILITGDGSDSTLGSLDLKLATSDLQSGRPPSLPDFSSVAQASPQRAMSHAGFSFIFDGENDWRYMAIELRQTSLASLHSTLEVIWPSGGAKVTRPTTFFVWEPESQLILLGGVLLPESGQPNEADQ